VLSFALFHTEDDTRPHVPEHLPIISYLNIRLVLTEYIVLCLYGTEHLPF